MFENSNFLPTGGNTGAMMQGGQSGAMNPQMLQMLLGLGGGLMGKQQPQQIPQQPMMMGQQGIPRQQSPVLQMANPTPFQPRMSMGLQRGLIGGY